MTQTKKLPALVEGALLRQRLADLGSGADLRKRVVEVLKETIKAARAEAERRLTADGDRKSVV